MAAGRKLQGEVDRCLKKVTEGAEAFEDIWQKVQNATNLNQKEKYEGELKREIKKLQRLREQIKGWLASSDVKDKKPLLDNRKLIEIQMERFRVIEKETKTKAYSKEGLGQANKIDPETKQYETCREWLNDAIHNLGFQVDQFESELETLQANTKKKKLDKDKSDRVDELQTRLEAHRFHISSLEHVLRKLDNETLEVDQVNKVREDVEYYIENCQEPDFVDDEGVYDDLDLQADTELEHSMRKEEHEDDDDIHSSPGSSINSAHSGILINSPASKSVNGSPRKNSKSSSSSITSALLNNVNSSISSTSISLSTTSTTTATAAKRNLFPTSTTPISLNSTSSIETFAENVLSETTQSIPMVNGIDHSIKEASISSSDTSSTPYAVAAAITSTTSTTKSSTVESATTNKSLSTAEQNAVQVVRNHVESLKYPGFNPSNTHWRPSSLSSEPDTTTISVNTTSSSSTILPSTSSISVTSSEESITKIFSDPLPAIENSLPLLTSSIEKTITTMSPISNVTNPLQNVMPPFPPVQNPLMRDIDKQLQSQPEFNLKSSTLFGGVLSPSLTQKLPNSDTQEVRLQPVHGVAPLGPVLLTQERLYQLKMLDSAFRHLPQRQDSERMRPYISRSAVPIAQYHHHQAPPNIDSLDFFQRLSTETLFFIFYYQEGTRAQYLAAKALKKQSWRFHTKYMMWFQRHEEPKRITDEFEEGTYIFFDYEKWSQRKRDGFTFEYRYLEDKDLP